MSTTERVGIEIDLMGYEEAVSHMQNLDRLIHGLNGRGAYLKIKAQVEDLKVNKKALQAHKVKLEVDASNVDKAIRKVKENIKELGKMKSAYENAYKSASEWVKRATPDEMDKAMRARTKAAENLERYYARMGQMRRGLDNLQSRRMGIGDEMRQTAAEIRQTTAALNMYEGALRRAGMAGKSLGDIFKGATTRAAHIGQAMQSAGNALTRMTYPMRMFTSGALMGAGYSAMNKVTEGLKAGFARYDIMQQYPRMMKQFETANFSATDSINKLDEAVRGMPTGLDEIVNMSQQFTMTMGDMEKGTDLAIAANNAFLSSMTDEAKRYQGMSQLRDVIGGKDMNSREWQSLAQSMMPAIRMMGEELGKSGKELDEWVSAVQQGKVSNEEFLDAMVKAGTKTDDHVGKVAQMAELSKDTWAAFSANVTNAFSRMGEGIIKTMDDVVAIASGGKYKKLNRMLAENVGPGIDKVAQAAQNWIKANPDKIIDFFESVKSVDWKGLGTGFVKGIGEMAGALKKAFDVMGGISSGKMQTIGKIIAWLPMIGNVLTIGGGFIKGGRHIIGATVTGIMGFARIIGAIASVAGAGLSAGIVANAVKAFKGLFKVSDVAKAGKMAKLQRFMRTMNRFSKLGKGIQPGAVIKSFMPAIELIGGLGIMVTEVSGAIAANTWLIKKSVDNITGIADGIDAVFKSARKLKKPNISMNNIRDAVNSVGEIYGILQGEVTEQRLGAANKASLGNVTKEEGLGALKPWKLSQYKTALDNLFGVFDNMTKVVNSFQPLTDAIKKNIGKGKTPFEGLKKLLTGKGGLLDSFKELTDDIDESLGDAPSISKVPTTIKNLKDTFDNIGKIADMVPELAGKVFAMMARGGGTGMGISPMDVLKQNLMGEKGLFSAIHGIFESINKDLLGLDGEEGGTSFNAGAIERLSGTMGNIETMFTSIGNIVGMMPDISETLGKMTTEGSSAGGYTTSFESMFTNLTVMMKRLGSLATEMDTQIPDAKGFDAKAESLVSAVDRIKQTVSKLSELGSGEMASTEGASFTAIESIKTMVSNLGQALNTDTIAQLQTDVASFQESVNSIFESLNKAVSDIEVTVTIKGTVKGHKELIGKIRAADRDIRAAVDAIQLTYNRTVTVNINRQVNMSGSVPSNVGAPESNGAGGGGGTVWRHTGGLIYRAKGGGVLDSIFKPKGVDTVPAMLQPGEYVQRKKAVDTFGVRFMQRINHLDVVGAFHELSARFGSVVGTSRGTSITNNITNNNSPTINQNINTNNPNFAFKRANRYVMAL